MPRHIFVGLIFLMALKGVKLDITLNKFKSELGNWSESIPKIWLSYIRMHLFKHLERYIEICQSVNNIVWHILSGTKLLLVMNNDTTVINECQDIRNMTIYCRFIVKHQVGQFVSYPKRICDYDTLVHWQLDARLHLNMTFLTIDFSFCWSNCPLKGYLNLVHLVIVNGLSRRCDSISKGPAHTFCGQYSSFSFFSKDNHVKMCNRYYFHEIGSEYKVVGMFMITDSNQLFNEPILKMKVKPQLVYNIRNKYKIFRFFITVNILNKIFLAMNHSKIDRYVVFDGPGLLSNTIYKTGKYILTSTFQCLILLLKSNNNEASFTFASHKIPVHNKVYIGQTNKSIFYYPNEKCKESSCISSFYADKGYQINITTISVYSKMSTHIFNCLYAGLYAGEGIVSDFIDTQKVTGNNDGQAVSFYSHNSSIILFVYWYKGISEINASVMISQTKCKPVVINPCYLFPCWKITEPDLCGFTYRQNLLNFFGIDIVFVHGLTKYKPVYGYLPGYGCLLFKQIHEYEYSLKGINCIIVLLSNLDLQHIFRKSCDITLNPRHAVNIQLRFIRYNSDFNIVGKKLEFSKSNLLSLENSVNQQYQEVCSKI